MNYLLYVVYVTFFGLLFLTNEFFLAYDFFLFVVSPVALLPVIIESGGGRGNLSLNDLKFSFLNTFQTLAPARSPIFFGIFCFGLALVVSSTITPSLSLAWFRIFSCYLLAICLFVLIVARLSIVFDDFCGAFFSCFCVIVAINAAINISIYFSGLNHFSDFSYVRMSPSFGRAPDHYFTTSALSYATALAGSAGLLFTEIDWLRRSIGFVSGIVLFIAICLTQSRGPLFASLAAIFVSGLVGWRQANRWLYVAIPIIAASIFLVIPEFSKSLIARADNHRVEIWKHFIDFALQRPVLGYGQRLIILMKISDGEELGHAHNIFISALMRSGIIGFVIIMLTYAASLSKTLQLDLRKHKPIPFAVLLTTLIAGFVDFDQILMVSDWQWVSFWLPLGLALGSEQIIMYESMSLFKASNVKTSYR